MDYYLGPIWKKFDPNPQNYIYQAEAINSPHIYIIIEHENKFIVRAGFTKPYGSFIELGNFEDEIYAFLCAENHDFLYGQSRYKNNEEKYVFVGSEFVKKTATEILKVPEGQEILDLLIDIPKLENGRPFFRVASYWNAQKGELKQLSDGTLQIVFITSVKELPQWLLESKKGAYIAMASLLISNNNENEEWERRGTDALRRLCMLPQDPLFIEWFYQRYDQWDLIKIALKHENSEAVEKACYETLKRLLGLPKKREILSNRNAIERLENYDRQYYNDLSKGFGLARAKNNN